VPAQLNPGTPPGSEATAAVLVGPFPARSVGWDSGGRFGRLSPVRAFANQELMSMFRLPDLPYGFSALAPTISETTLRTHHGKHHARYVQVTNELVAETRHTPIALEDLVADADHNSARKLFNNAAQAWNHGFFWECMGTERSPLSGALRRKIDEAFGGLSQLKQRFTAEGAAHFGSGWVWLVASEERLSVIATHDAAAPIVAPGLTPLLVCDLWEHAYYLDHKNDRAGFLSAWWDLLVNWDFVDRQYAAALGQGASWRYPSPEAG
jgi:superoxide dismutase, Fe-Mn family